MVVLVDVATAPAAAVAHLKVERRDMLLDGVPQGAVSFDESFMLFSASFTTWVPSKQGFHLPSIAWHEEREKVG